MTAFCDTYRTDSVITCDVEHIFGHVAVEAEKEHAGVAEKTADYNDIVEVGGTHLDKSNVAVLHIEHEEH